MEVKVGDIVMPGDMLVDVSRKRSEKEKSKEKETIVLGPGLRREADLIYACKAGILKQRKPAVYYVDTYQKRYVPSRGENVVGIVTQKVGDVFKVDIGASDLASLPYLAFEGATKKNRPDIQVGDVIFGKLSIATKDMEPELICIDVQGKEKKLGLLSSDGMLFNCSLSLVRKILNPDYPLFDVLASNQAYELAAGMNGKIWVRGRSVQETIAVANAILGAEFTAPTEIGKLCARIERSLLLCDY